MFVALQEIARSDGCMATVGFCMHHGEHSAEEGALSQLGFHLLLNGSLYFVVVQWGGESCLVLFLVHGLKICEVRVQHFISEGTFRCTPLCLPQRGLLIWRRSNRGTLPAKDRGASSCE